MKRTTLSVAQPDYRRFIEDLKVRVTAARVSAARHVNRDLILLYWDIGRAIVEKQKTLGWGDSVVEMVAKDLRRAFPGARGFSANNVWLMRQFFLEYSSSEFLEQAVQEMGRRRHLFLEQPVPETAPTGGRRLSYEPASILEQLVQEILPAIPWGHHVEIVKKIKAPMARLWYLQATARFGWSRNVLLNQIKAEAYERVGGLQLATPSFRLRCGLYA